MRKKCLNICPGCGYIKWQIFCEICNARDEWKLAADNSILPTKTKRTKNEQGNIDSRAAKQR